MVNDYFADRLLAKLDIADPIFAAYEAQDISKTVGFDFNDFQDVVPRAMDEIRETKQALVEIEDNREHFGDEVADIMFSLINLARHAGMNDLPAYEEIEKSEAQKTQRNYIDSEALIDDIGNRIQKVAELEKSFPESFKAKMNELFMAGTEDSILLAKAHGFEARKLLVENVRKYLIRCQAIEQLAFQDNKQWADLAANNEIVAYWKKAKTLLE